ncbi:MAG: glycosyltransferase family 4 protein [Actinomycetaceae bacterium]|nr:glycosyltransferase family 4 protein [Actinomycetaceae bacterium]
MKIGIVCPYSFDVHGGVQFHVRDLAEELIRRGHDVSVLAPAEEEVPAYVTAVSGSYSVPYNGSVAKLSLSPLAFRATRLWLEEGQFDVVHIHEPLAPSISLFALALATSPIVATFHTSMDSSRALRVAAPVLAPLLERIRGRIAVSQEARRTLIQHQGGDAVIIPNGVYTAAYEAARPIDAWAERDDRPIISFLGRLDEPRKGLRILLGAIDEVREAHPGARFLIAGRGSNDQAAQHGRSHDRNLEFLGGISDEEKESLFSGSTIYVAPQTGGESFGIVLVEAMAAGACVVASDIEAFRLVLADGDVGYLFATGDSHDLAHTLIRALDEREQTTQLALKGQEYARRFDWSVVTDDILQIYQTVIDTNSEPVLEAPRTLVDSIRKVAEKLRSEVDDE